MFKLMRYTILGVEIDPITHGVAEDRIKHWLAEQPSQPKVLFTPNPEILTYAQSHPPYQAILNAGHLNVADGIGVVWLSNHGLPERITGADIVQTIIRTGRELQLSIGVVLKPTSLSGAKDLPGMITTYDRFQQVPAIILVTLGFPEQEQWIHDHMAELAGCRLVAAVGGGIDFFTGKQQRAPLLFRRFGLEWLWRWLLQPQRWRRILTATVVFPYLVLKQRFFHG